MRRLPHPALLGQHAITTLGVCDSAQPPRPPRAAQPESERTIGPNMTITDWRAASPQAPATYFRGAISIFFPECAANETQRQFNDDLALDLRDRVNAEIETDAPATSALVQLFLARCMETSAGLGRLFRRPAGGVNFSTTLVANPGHMGLQMIPDADLTRDADRVTIWIASPPGPKDVWCLREAVQWAAQRNDVTLHRPSRDDASSAWVKPDQVARLAHMLGVDQATDIEPFALTP